MPASSSPEFGEFEIFANIQREVEFTFLELPDIEIMEADISANDLINRPNSFIEPNIDIKHLNDVKLQASYRMLKDSSSVTFAYGLSSAVVGIVWLSVGKAMEAASTPVLLEHGSELIGKAGLYSAAGMIAVSGINAARAMFVKRKAGNA